MEVKGFTLTEVAKFETAPDPIVMKPVFYKGKAFKLICSAWGKEAEDELVVNEKLN